MIGVLIALVAPIPCVMTDFRGWIENIASYKTSALTNSIVMLEIQHLYHKTNTHKPRPSQLPNHNKGRWHNCEGFTWFLTKDLVIYTDMTSKLMV
jgi:hypothetical protein